MWLSWRGFVAIRLRHRRPKMITGLTINKIDFE